VAITPAKMEIWNVQEGTILKVQFNPRKLPEKLKAVWTAHVVPGMSHAPLQYSHTGNWECPIELVWVVRAKADEDAMQNARRFLQSLLVPWRGHTSPPRALLNWPKMVSLTVVVTEFEGEGSVFDKNLQAVVYTAKLSCQEIRDARYYGDDVLKTGPMRGTGASLV
jgi:hypothetical protein